MGQITTAENRCQNKCGEASNIWGEISLNRLNIADLLYLLYY